MPTSDGATPRAEKVALVTGAHGVIGAAVYEHLARRPGWRTVGTARRPAPDDAPAPWVRADLLDAAAARRDLAGCHDVTHVFFGAYAANHDMGLEAAQNRDLLANTLDALAAAGAPLEHLTIYHGAKAYGAHLGPFRTPAHESDPRVPGPLLYHDQEDLLRERGPRDGFHWTILRPDFIGGPAVGSPINLVVGIAVYGALCRALGRPFAYPGGEVGARMLVQSTDARLIAEASEWAATAPAAADEIFNLTNGDAYRWGAMWPRLAGMLGFDDAPVEDFSLAEFAADKADLWDDLVERHGLRPYPFSSLVDWHYLEAMVSPRWDVLSSTIKIRQAGFGGCLDSAQMFADVFAEAVARRIVPAP